MLGGGVALVLMQLPMIFLRMISYGLPRAGSLLFTDRVGSGDRWAYSSSVRLVRALVHSWLWLCRILGFEPGSVGNTMRYSLGCRGGAIRIGGPRWVLGCARRVRSSLSRLRPEDDGQQALGLGLGQCVCAMGLRTSGRLQKCLCVFFKILYLFIF